MKSKKKEPHNPKGKVVGYVYCVKCGLVYLKNDATFKAIRAPCPDDRDV